MPVPLTKEMVEDYLMSKSVMDEPRSLPQKLFDFFLGRTYPEQALGAFTNLSPLSVGPGKLALPKGARGTQDIYGDYLKRAYQGWRKRFPQDDKGFEDWSGADHITYLGQVLQDVLTRDPRNPINAVKNSGWYVVGGESASDLERAAQARIGFAGNPSISERQLLPEKMAELQQWIREQLGY